MTKYLFSLIFLVLGSFTSIHAQCHITDLSIDRTVCNADGKFDVKINFNYEGIGDLGFRIQGNGVNYGEFDYAALPITLKNLNGNCETPYEFVIRDIANPTCSESYNLGKVCCNLDCDMQIVNLKLDSCVNGGYNATFNLEFSQLAGDFVKVYANGVFIDNFSTNHLPITLEDIASVNDIDNSIVVCDALNPMCCDTIYFASPCVCAISNIRSRIIECNPIDSTFFVRFDFETNMVSDSFQIGGNGIFFGTKAYNKLPAFIGPIPFTNDTTYYLIVDKKNSFCFDEMIIPPVKECDTQCRFENVGVTISDCGPDDGFYAYITFDTNNPGLNGFKIRGNGKVYGEHFEYGKESYKVGPLLGDCQTLYEFILIDNDINDCQGEVVLDEPVCCLSCSIRDLSAVGICIDDSVKRIDINFIYENSVDSLFTVKINSDTYGPFHHNDLPLSIDVALSGSDEIRVEVSDQSDPDCKKVKEFNPNCGEVPCGEFTHIFTEFSDCLENNTYFLDISFSFDGVHSDSFFIKIFDKIYGPFVYGKDFYRLGPFESNCKRTFFTLIDADRPDCQKVHEIDEIKCCNDCEIGDVKINVECVEGTMVGFTIKVGNDGQQFSKYSFKLKNETYGPFSYNDFQTVTISLPDGAHAINIFDVEFDDCTKEVQMEVNCDEECNLGELLIETVNCTEETFQFVITLNHNRNPNDLFKLFINQELKGTSSYSFLPFTTPKLNRNDGGPWHILIKDGEKENCATDINIEEELCESGIEDIRNSMTIISNPEGILLRSTNDLGKFNIKLFDILGRQDQSIIWNSANELQLRINNTMSKFNILMLEQDGQIYSTKVIRI